MLNIVKLNLKDKKQPTININNGNLVNQTRHYPPDSKEWFNSIYAFNKNTTKLLPIADTVIIKLIRSYFNLYSANLDKKVKSPLVRNRLRKLSTNRILVSKAEVRHTSDKVLITVYLYNRQKKYYLDKINKISLLGLKIVNLKFLVQKIKIILIRLINLKKKINFLDNKYLIKLRDFRYLINLRKILGLKKRKNFRYIKFLNKRMTFLNIREKLNSKMKLIKPEALSIASDIRKEKFVALQAETITWKDNKFKQYEKIFIHNFTLKHLEKGLLYMYYKQVLFLNKSKFNYNYILPLKSLIKKIYNKRVEFNLVTLKYFHLNSDIFTQILTIKLRNRKNRILRVLKTSLRAINLPSINKFFILEDLYNRKKKLQTLIVKDLLFDPLFVKKNHSSDRMDNILEKYLPVNLNIEFIKYLKKIVLTKFLPLKLRTEFKKLLKNPRFNVSLSPLIKKEYDKFCKNTVLSSLKHKVVNGIRIEASGRLTRRITASRAVFKLRYIGNLKNTDSSFKGLSSVILRGHFKSNLQYTKLGSNTRIGSFGLKSWINSN